MEKENGFEAICYNEQEKVCFINLYKDYHKANLGASKFGCRYELYSVCYGETLTTCEVDFTKNQMFDCNRVFNAMKEYKFADILTMKGNQKQGFTIYGAIKYTIESGCTVIR